MADQARDSRFSGLSGLVAMTSDRPRDGRGEFGVWSRHDEV